jgi:hypothetical protein
VTTAAYAETKDGRVELFSFEHPGAPADPAAVGSVMMSRLDLDAHIVELPAIRDEEVEGFLRYRMPSIYPGHRDQTAFDYRILRRGRRRWAVLLLVRQTVLDAYREATAGRPLFAPLSLVEPSLEGSGRRDALVVFWHEAWVEVFRLPVKGPPRSVVVTLSGDTGEDLGRVRSATSDGSATGAAWSLYCPGREIGRLGEWARACAGTEGTVEVTAIEDALRRLGRRRSFLFARRRNRPGLPSRGTRLQLYAGAALLLGVLLLARSAGRDDRALRELSAEVELAEGRRTRAVAIERELAAARGELEALRARRPVDPYLVLSELETILSPGSIVSAFTLENRTFRLEAVGPDPLGLMDAFHDNGLFESVKLVQIVPQKGSGNEQYTLTGAVRVD